MNTRQFWLKDGRVVVGEFTVVIDMYGRPVYIKGREAIDLARYNLGHEQVWPIESVLKWNTMLMQSETVTAIPKIVGSITDDGIGPFKRWMDEGFDRGWVVMHRSDS